jgi:hypothetical protein
MGRNAASVFPVPVGAIKRTFLLFEINGIAALCGSVGERNPFFEIIL